MTAEFETFPKIQRYEKGACSITEKLDGTNACLVFDEDGGMTCQSRNRIITPGAQNDNAGFAGWAAANREELFYFFGEGRHYGEWWGVGIQRGYGLVERRFSPFNVDRFNASVIPFAWPNNVTPVPVLGRCMLPDLNATIDTAMESLATEGSQAAPGWYDTEGAMVYCHMFGYLKVPFEGAHKWELAA
jgi:hypothetical protein